MLNRLAQLSAISSRQLCFGVKPSKLWFMNKQKTHYFTGFYVSVRCTIDLYYSGRLKRRTSKKLKIRSQEVNLRGYVSSVTSTLKILKTHVTCHASDPYCYNWSKEDLSEMYSEMRPIFIIRLLLQCIFNSLVLQNFVILVLTSYPHHDCWHCTTRRIPLIWNSSQSQGNCSRESSHFVDCNSFVSWYMWWDF